MALTKISTAMWNSVPHHDTHDFNVDDVLYVDVSANRVGIGTDSPNGSLDVRTGGQSGVPSLGTVGNGINLTRTDGQTGGSIGYTTEGHIYIQSQRFDSANANDLFLQPVGGNIGIGTASPSTKLHVEGSSIIANSTAINPDSYTNKVVAGAIAQASNWGLTSAIGGNGGPGDSWAIGTNGSYLYMGYGDQANTNSLQTFLQVLGRNVSLVPDNGNVGIGTTLPNHIISIQGGDIAKYTTTGIDGTYDNFIKYGYYDNLQSGGSYQNRWIGFDATISAGGAIDNVLRARVYGGGFGNIAPVNVVDFRGHQSSIFYGNVGIGTPNPSVKFDVAGNSTNNIGLTRFTNNYSAGGVYFPAASFINTRGNHSYGIVADFRINTLSDGDRPSILFFGQATSTSWQIGQQTGTAWGGSADAFGIGYRASNDPNSFSAWCTAYFTVDTSGNTLSYASSRAPIFYDSDNTGYYLNPAEASTSGIIRGKIVVGPNVSWAKYLQIGGNGREYVNNADVASVVTTNGNLHLDAASGLHTYINFYDGDRVNFGDGAQSIVGEIHSDGSARFSSFYDYNDTTYYLDPTSTGAISSIKTGGGQIGTSLAHKLTVAGNGNYMNINFDQIWNAGGHLHLQYSSGYNVDMCAGGGYAWSRTSLRAPIFYDSDNTTYYTDPSYISSMYGIAIRGDQGSSDSINQIFLYGSGDTTTSAIGFKYSAGEFTNPTGSGDGWNTYLSMDTDGRGWVFRRATGGSDFTSAYTAGWILNNGIAQFNSSSRAPIFYDSDNTGYYLNPNSYSQLNHGNFNSAPSGRTLSLGSDDISRVFNDTARSSLVINATYYPHLYINATGANNNEHGAVISMTGNLTAGGYRRWGMGIGNRDPNALSWGYYDNQTNPHYGVGGDIGYTTTGSKMWLNTGGNLATVGSMRSPIFYDYDDTTYYLNPNSNGSLLRGRINVRGEHYTTSIRLFLDGSDNGAGTGPVNLQAWCSEPGNSWDGAGFGYNVDNNTNEPGNVPSYYFGRYNTSFGQAYMRMLSDGNWNFYNTASGSTIRYTTMQLTNSGYVFAPASVRSPIFYDSDNTVYYLNPNSTGDSLRAAGDIIAYYSSDRRLKDNIIKIDSALDKVNAIGGYTFEWNEESHKQTGSKDVGVIAQEVEEIFPEIVQTRSNGYKAVNYEKLVPLLIEAVKELSEKVKILENK